MRTLLFIQVLFIVAVLATSDPEFTERARQHLISSWSASCPEDQLKNWTCYWCVYPGNQKTIVTHYFNGEEKLIFGYGGITEDSIIFSFRGTHGLSNWLQDLKYFRTTPFHDLIPGALVHSGFLEAYMSLRDEILVAAKELSTRYPDLPVRVVGHSLGGAIASLAAVDFALNKTITNRINLWSYGCPRVGNAEFANFLSSKYLNASRIVWKRDPVPHLPPEFVGYQHYNTEFWYNTPTEFAKCTATEDPLCSDSIWIDSLFDHNLYLGIDSKLAHPYGCGGMFNV